MGLRKGDRGGSLGEIVSYSDFNIGLGWGFLMRVIVFIGRFVSFFNKEDNLK